ncbi:MAG: hypothetical protein AAGF49_16925, partial [Pseudomonadota bacterium]
MIAEFPRPLIIGFAVILAVLVVASFASIRLAGIRARVATWWVIAALAGVAVLAGQLAVVILFALIS